MGLPDPDQGHTVVVTGASSGIGESLSRELAIRGYGLTLVARRRDRLDDLADELREAHEVDVEVLPTDLGDRRARAGLLAAIQRGTRSVAGLCNNAGFGTFGRLWELDGDRERGQVEVNAVALHDLTLALLPGMVERGEGAVLNVGSIAGGQPLPGNATYAATKAFVNSLSEALHSELSGTGVSCTVLTPGPVRTEFVEVADAGSLEGRAPGFVWADAIDVARQAVDGMVDGKRVVAPGLATKVVAQAGRLTPRAVLLPITKAAYRRRG